MENFRTETAGRRRPGALALSFGALILAAIALSACGPDGAGDGNEGAAGMPTRDINTVMEAHVDELMAIPGVVGVAIGALDDGTPMIMVLVVEETDAIKEKIPEKLEGHPVRITVSGEIKPMSAGD